MSARDILRIVFNLALGPLLGGVMFFVVVAIFEVVVLKAPPQVLGNFQPASLPWLVGFVYLVSALPALLNGVVTSLVSRRTKSVPVRIVAALASGALWSGLIIGAVVSAGDTTVAPPTTFTILATVLGALDSLLVYALFERLVPARNR